MIRLLSPSEYAAIAASPMLAEEAAVVSGNAYLAVDVSSDVPQLTARFAPVCPVIGVGQAAHQVGWVDVSVADDAQLGRVIEGIDAQPLAATTLVQVLRHNERCSIDDGLLAESLAYSTLQHGAGFLRWLDAREAAPRLADEPEPLLVTREGDVLSLTFNRPERHNAFARISRDALCDALQLALSDERIQRVELSGAGPSFCAGGDLDEFGIARDAAVAHASRTARSAAALLAALSERVHVRVHGACIGAGIELPAFAGRIEARDDAFFQLPEVAFGLVPGAGGTVSVPRRIGRRRTAYLALSNVRLDAATALEWGLVDALV